MWTSLRLSVVLLVLVIFPFLPVFCDRQNAQNIIPLRSEQQLQKTRKYPGKRKMNQAFFFILPITVTVVGKSSLNREKKIA